MRNIDKLLQEKIEKQRKQKLRKEKKRLNIIANFIIESALVEHKAKK